MLREFQSNFGASWSSFWRYSGANLEVSLGPLWRAFFSDVGAAQQEGTERISIRLSTISSITVVFLAPVARVFPLPVWLPWLLLLLFLICSCVSWGSLAPVAPAPLVVHLVVRTECLGLAWLLLPP